MSTLCCCFPFRIPQSVVLSAFAMVVELMGLAILLRSEDPTFRTVVLGTLVRFLVWNSSEA
jgi:hypothetical protein